MVETIEMKERTGRSIQTLLLDLDLLVLD